MKFGLDTTNTLRAVFSFDPSIIPSNHIVEKENINGMQVITNEKVKIGTMSFQMDSSEEFDINWYHLVTSEKYSPKTGIKINKDLYTYYEAPSTFRFTNATASDTATLNSLKVTSGKQDLEEPENSTYKEYLLNPEFQKEIYKYNIEIMDYIDKVDIIPELTDTNSTLKVRLPRRDENRRSYI